MNLGFKGPKGISHCVPKIMPLSDYMDTEVHIEVVLKILSVMPVFSLVFAIKQNYSKCVFFEH